MNAFSAAGEMGHPWRTPGRWCVYGRYTIGRKQAVSRADPSGRPEIQGSAQGQTLPLTVS